MNWLIDWLIDWFDWSIDNLCVIVTVVVVLDYEDALKENNQHRK